MRIYRAFSAAAVGPVIEAARLVNAVGRTVPRVCDRGEVPRAGRNRSSASRAAADEAAETEERNAYGELNIGWNGLAAAPEYAGRRAMRRMRLRTTWRLTAGCRFVCVGCAVALSLVGAATAVRWMLSVTSPSAAVAGAGTLDAGGGTAAGTESAIAPGRAAFPFGGSLRALPVSRLSSLSGASDFAITGGPIAPGMVRSAPPAEWRCHALDAKGAAAEARSSEAPES